MARLENVSILHFNLQAHTHTQTDTHIRAIINKLCVEFDEQTEHVLYLLILACGTLSIRQNKIIQAKRDFLA